MKQLLKNMNDGKSVIADVPVPAIKPLNALVRTGASLVSVGTERMVVDFAEKSLIGKAQSRPDLVRQVIDKAKREGVLSTVEAAFGKLEQPMALGYSSAGTIVEMGEGLKGFKIGDKVACAGGGHAVHAEYGLIPQNLLVKIPERVDFESASFATLGAIALQGVRLAGVQVGEKVAVIGMGLLGLLTVQIAKAAGCDVFGVDLDAKRVELARTFGVQAGMRANAEAAGAALSNGRGFDAVLICADTKSNDPIELAGVLAREKGKVIAVGAVGLDIPRKLYYEKELDFQVSRSYGPGRYDVDYEENAVDYPYGYVRWTENRNMEAVLDLIAKGQLDVQRLITHRFDINQATEAYELISHGDPSSFLGVVITYAQNDSVPQRKIEMPAYRPLDGAIKAGLSVLGAGNYAMSTFLPAVEKTGMIQRIGVVSGGGLSARNAAQRFGFQFASSDEEDAFQNEDTGILAVLTRHDQHARQVLKGLELGKAVFCEKPLTINRDKLVQIKTRLEEHSGDYLTIGYNRRFAPLTQNMKEFFANRSEPMYVHYRVNAGYIPLNHWVHDPAQGGGRWVGEGCHFVDYVINLVGQVPASVYAASMPNKGKYAQDNLTVTLSFEDGSIGVVTYLANGDKSLPKEYCEVFCDGSVARLHDYRSLELTQGGKTRTIKSALRQDKGHQALWEKFVRGYLEKTVPPIPYDQIIGGMKAVFAAIESISSGEKVELDHENV